MLSTILTKKPLDQSQNTITSGRGQSHAFNLLHAENKAMSTQFVMEGKIIIKASNIKK